MKINLKLNIETPDTPDYIFSQSGKLKYHISEFSKEELQKIGELWTTELIKKAGK